MSRRGLAALFAIAAVSAVVANAVLAADSNRNVLTVNHNQCPGQFCSKTNSFSATGLCVEAGGDSSYIAICNVTNGAFTLKQFPSKDCSGEPFRNITSATKQYTGTQSTFRLPYTHPETSPQEKVTLCNNSCNGDNNCIASGRARELFYCRNTTLFDKQYFVTGLYGTLTNALVRFVYSSEAECQRKRLPLFFGDANEKVDCASYTPQYNTMCTPVTQTGSSTATATAMLSTTATATATIRLPTTATATATLPTTTATTTTQATTETTGASSTTTATTPTAATPATTAAATTPTATTAASTSGLNIPVAAARGDGGGDATDSNSNGVCVWCIVVPIVIVLLLLCIGLLIWLLCCQRREEVKVLDDVEFEAVPNPLHEANGENYYSAQPTHEANGENYYPAHLGQPANGEVAESQQQHNTMP